VKSKVEKLCQAFENISAEFVDLTDVHPNVIANVVKLYMRQLPEPLMTFRLYSEFIRVGRACPAPGSGASAPADEREAVTQLAKLCGQLPKHHYNTLGFLCHHLNRVAEQAEVNNMPASNLAIVFGPTLLKTTEGSASLSSLVDTVHQTRVVELLTRHATTVFGPPPIPGEGPGGRGSRQRPSDRHSGSDAVPADIRIGSISDDEVDGDNEPLPDFLLPEYSKDKVKRSPLTGHRAISPPPKIFTVSLKNMSGLEGVKTNHLSTQHSVDLANNPTKRSLSTSTTSKEEGEVVEERENNPSRTSVSSSIVSIEENRVKIQVPGLPLSGVKEANNK
jgi:hypothetical protein